MTKAALQAKLGAAIRARRLSRNVSQEAFADSITMHRAYYAAIERGERNVTLMTIARVADGLGCKIADLARDAAI